VLAIDRGVFPWIALVLAFSFGFYGLLRKVAPVGPLIGLLLETALLFPLALLVISIPAQLALPVADLTTRDLGLLALAGVVTAVPLLLFADAARKLRLATIGFLQYIGPSVQFLLAVLLFGEPFGMTQATTFGLIWTAVAIYSADSLHAHRLARSGTSQAPDLESGASKRELETSCEPL
jgi:chloramphenicol-sensitive protein RarD